MELFNKISKFEIIGTYVTVGFMPLNFIRMFDVLELFHDLLPRPIVVQAAGLEHHPFFARCESVFSTCSQEDAEMYMRSASFIITHCGVGSMKSVVSLQKRAVFFPRIAKFLEHVDNHQIELARLIDDENIGTVVWPNTSYKQLGDTIKRAQEIAIKPRALHLEFPQIDESRGWLLVSSVGGHRSEISRFASNVPIIGSLTDEECYETKTGSALRFPSCGKKIYFFIRLIQALVFLRSQVKTSKQEFGVLTTGAGVGAIFVIASRLLGLKSIAIESLTRIDKPSLWFRVANRFASEAYCYSWAKWSTDYPKICTLNATFEAVPALSHKE
jgi:UDP-N-acetylglucosamine transferase subunit ALG13